MKNIPLIALVLSIVLTSTGNANCKSAKEILDQISIELAEFERGSIVEINVNHASSHYSYNFAAKELEELLQSTDETPNPWSTGNKWVNINLNLNSDFGTLENGSRSPILIENGTNSAITKKVYLTSLETIKTFEKKGWYRELTIISNGTKTINGHEVFAVKYRYLLSEGIEKKEGLISNYLLVTGIQSYVLEIRISSMGFITDEINDICLRMIQTLQNLKTDPKKDNKAFHHIPLRSTGLAEARR